MSRGHTSKGFTAIEFLIAGLFIATLALIAFGNFYTARIEERDTKRIDAVEMLRAGLADYFDTFGGYPSTLSVLEREGFAPLLLDPKTKEAYLYAPLGQGCTSYHLGARFEDKRHPALFIDADFAPQASGVNCPDGGATPSDFSGLDPVYDIKP